MATVTPTMSTRSSAIDAEIVSPFRWFVLLLSWFAVTLAFAVRLAFLTLATGPLLAALLVIPIRYGRTVQR